ncbi:VOC family protein [Bosea sp. LjRoot9]
MSPNVPSEAFDQPICKSIDLDKVPVQLCQPSKLDNQQRKFLEAHGEGVFHLDFEVPDCDAGEAAAKAEGMSILMSAPRGSKRLHLFRHRQRIGWGRVRHSSQPA